MNIQAFLRAVLLLLLSLPLQPGLHAQEQAQLVPLTLVVDGKALGLLDCMVSPSQDKVESMDARSLGELLASLVSPDVLARVVRPDVPAISPGMLENAGLVPVFDPASLELRLSVPLAARKSERLSLGPGSQAVTGTIIRQEDFSAWLNVHAYQHLSVFFPEVEGPSWSASFDIQSAINLYGWVLDTRTNISTVTGPELPLISLTRDFLPAGMRMTAGSFTLGSRGFLPPESGQGLMFARHGPASGNSSAMEQDLYLDQDSTVEVWMNGRKIRTLQLDRGRYALSELPFYNGINQVELRITYEDGTRRVLQSLLPEDTESLAPGEDDWTYSLGIPPWDPSDVIFNIRHSWGLASWLNAGVGSRLALSGGTFILDFLLPTPLGTFSLDGGIKLTDWDSSNPDFAIHGGWRYRNNTDPFIPTFGLGISWTGPDFQDDASMSPVALSITGTVAENLGLGLSASTSLSWQTYHNGDPDDLNLSVHLNLAIGADSSLSIGFSSTLPAPDLASTSLTLQVQIHDPASDTTFNANQDLVHGGTRMDLQKTSPAEGIDFSLSGQGPDTSAIDAFSLGASFRASRPRYLFSTSLGLIRNSGTGANTELRANLDLAGALVFAGGHLSLSRPITDSFALVIPRYDLAGQAIGINGSGKTWELSSDLLGFPVISQLSSGKTRQIAVDVLDSSPDSPFARENNLVLYPGYHSGTVINVGSIPEILVSLKLKDSHGKTMAWVSGEMRGDQDPVEFFSDENGLAMIYGIHAGVYTIHIDGFQDQTIDLVSWTQGSWETEMTLTALEGADQ